MRTAQLPVIELRGTPRERGRAHGEALRSVITGKIERWHEAIQLSYGEPADEFLPRFLAGTDFRPVIRRWTPELPEEISGIAEGAGIAEETAYALQLMDEEWWFGRNLTAAHCSSLGLRTGGEPATLLGQTMDLPRWHDGAQALLRLQDEAGVEQCIFTSAGMVGLMGISGRGLGLCVNTLIQLSKSRSGLPVAYALRGALAQADHDKAVAFLSRVRHASGQNFLVGDRKAVTALECSAGGAVRVPPSTPDRVWHTNHPLASRDLVEADRDPGSEANSRGRLASLERQLGTAAVIDLALVKATLAARDSAGPISAEPSAEAGPTAFMTVGAVIYELGESLRLHLAAGPPSRESWQSFDVQPALDAVSAGA